MARLFSDDDLLTWEAFPSGGPFGFPQHPKIIFQCLSDPDRRSRFIHVDGDSASAEKEVHSLSTDQLRQLLARSAELD